MENLTKPTGNKRGRPPKSDLQEIKASRGIGRPKGDASIIQEFKLRMLNSPKSPKVLEAIYNAALTDGHPGQTAAWKIITDRIIPASVFDTAKQANGGVPQISINISSLGTPKIETLEDVVDVEDNTDS